MNMAQSILVALICISVVFIVLIVLWGLIRLFSIIVMAAEKSKKKLNETNN